MDNSFDLVAYFNRIGFTNDATPDLETLKTLHTLHTQTIPFENINPLLQLPVKLDIDAVQQKLIHQKRGGYCFEQNLLFQKVLEEIGYQVTSHSGRVLLSRHEDTITPKTHMLLMVCLNNNQYIIDVGFGGQSPCEPILLKPNVKQDMIHGKYRILEKEEFYLLQIAIKGRWTNLYRFTTRITHPLDYKIANWFTSTHPDSHFTYKLTVALAGENCRYVINNNQFKTYCQDGTSQKKILSSAKEIIQTLENVFGLVTSHIDNFENKLNKILNIKTKEVENI